MKASIVLPLILIGIVILASWLTSKSERRRIARRMTQPEQRPDFNPTPQGVDNTHKSCSSCAHADKEVNCGECNQCTKYSNWSERV